MHLLHEYVDGYSCQDFLRHVLIFSTSFSTFCVNFQSSTRELHWCIHRDTKIFLNYNQLREEFVRDEYHSTRLSVCLFRFFSLILTFLKRERRKILYLNFHFLLNLYLLSLMIVKRYIYIFFLNFNLWKFDYKDWITSC